MGPLAGPDGQKQLLRDKVKLARTLPHSRKRGTWHMSPRRTGIDRLSAVCLAWRVLEEAQLNLQAEVINSVQVLEHSVLSRLYYPLCRSRASNFKERPI